LADIHYASDGEKARRDYFVQCVTGRLRRFVLHYYRRYYWQRDPFVHNYLLDDFIARAEPANLVVALGDYSCDSGFVGLADSCAFASAAESLGKLKGAFDGRFLPIIGDHELGKRPLGAAVGGMRYAAYERTRELGVEPFWKTTIGNHVLVGVTSSLVALPVFAPETAPEELPAWEKLREAHMADIRRAFGELTPNQRVILFCHDPTALPFLWRDGVVRGKLGQLERTLIGHLHSNLFLFKSRMLAGMPAISFVGHSIKRFSSALREARYWKPFKLFLCPSLSGIELLKDGGYCTIYIDSETEQPARFERHHLKRRAA
jgi:hypothetical protein